MVETSLLSLAEIFNQRFFRIPDYQRGYAWGTEQLEDFWDDLQNLKEGRNHYTGLLTVEYVKKEDAEKIEKWKDDLWMYDKGYKAYSLIDGQQRLATIIILLKVMIDRFYEDEIINFEEKRDIIKKYFYQQSGEYKSFIFGYEKDDPSNEYFITKILNEPSLSADKVPGQTLYTMNLNKAKKYFEKKIKNLSNTEVEENIKKLLTSFKFNFYEIDDELDVFVAFETMNNRGKDLSRLELLKNRLIYLTTLLGNKERDKRKLRNDINEAWKTIYEYLGKNKDNPIDDDDFLKNHWVMYFIYERSESQIFSKFLLKKYFTTGNVLRKKPKIPITFNEIKDYVDSISNSVKKWFYIHNPSFSDYNNEIIEWLEKLNRVGFGAFPPLIMTAMVKEENEEDLMDLLKATERFVFIVFRISRRQSYTRNNYFFRLANKYYKDKYSIREVIEDIEEETDDEENGWVKIDGFYEYIKEQFKKESGYYSWNGIKYFLYEYESYLHNNAKGKIKIYWEEFDKGKKEESIEHIFPQEGNKKCWKDIFNKYTKKERKLLLHSLGNLLLISISKNSELQNECFDFKKKHKNTKGKNVGYYNGSYSEIEVAQNKKWREKEILNRGLKMLEFLEERWEIELGNRKEKKELLGIDFL